DRVAVPDAEFVQRCGIIANHFSISLAKLIRDRLAQVGSIPADRILPEDSLGQPMSYICRWPEFEATVPLKDFERQLNVSASPERLERIPDPTSRRGSVGELFFNLYKAYSEGQRDPGKR